MLLLIEVNKEVVLFSRMPKFVSFMVFSVELYYREANYLCELLMRSSHRQIKFCAFHVISVEFYNFANEMQGRVPNVTVLFSHCVEKKATLEEEEF